MQYGALGLQIFALEAASRAYAWAGRARARKDPKAGGRLVWAFSLSFALRIIIVLPLRDAICHTRAHQPAMQSAHYATPSLGIACYAILRRHHLHLSAPHKCIYWKQSMRVDIDTFIHLEKFILQSFMPLLDIILTVEELKLIYLHCTSFYIQFKGIATPKSN